MGGPLWSPVGGDGIVFFQDGSEGNRTRATMKALPTALRPPSPLRNPGTASWVDAYAVNLGGWVRSTYVGVHGLAVDLWGLCLVVSRPGKDRLPWRRTALIEC